MIWIGALLFLIVPGTILVMVMRDDARAERSRPPTAWVRRLWRGSIQNRRRHERHRASIPLTYRVISDGAHEAQGVTHDLSLGGVGIVLSEKLQPGTEVELRLQCAPDAGVLTVRGTVRWVREMSPQPGEARRLFWAGLQLIATSTMTDTQLQAILSQLSSNGGGAHA